MIIFQNLIKNANGNEILVYVAILSIIGALVGSLIALITQLVNSYLINRRQLTINKKSRDFELRRNVYFKYMSSISKNNILLIKLSTSDDSVDENIRLESQAEMAANLAQLCLVGSLETIRRCNDYSLAYLDTYMSLALKRLKINDTAFALNASEAHITNLTQQQSLALEKMQLVSSFPPSNNKSTEIDRLTSHNDNIYRSINIELDKQETLVPTLAKQRLELLKYSTEKLVGLTTILNECIVFAREDLYLDTNINDFKVSMNETSIKSKEKLDTFIEELKERL